MARKVECPSCEKPMGLPEDAEGKKVRCSACGTSSRIHATDGGTLFLEALDEGEIFEESREAPVPRSARAAAPARRASSAGRGGPGQGGRGRRRAAREAPVERGRGRARAPEGHVPVFVLGLLSVVLCSLLGPIAIFMGLDYGKRCKRMRARPDGLATAGTILGVIGTIILLLTILYFALVWGVVSERLNQGR